MVGSNHAPGGHLVLVRSEQAHRLGAADCFHIMVAGAPEDWVEWLTDAYAPAGLNHALLSFTDPYTLKAWADREVAGLPDLVEQV